jgi:subtilisin family serine protease
MSIIRLAGSFSSVSRAKLVFLLLASLLCTAQPGFTQLPQVLPGTQLPQVQVPGLPLPETTRAVTGGLRELTGARVLRANRLFNEHRAQLDRDPRGELVVRAEVVAIDITPAALSKALAAKFNLLRSVKIEDLGVSIAVLQTPEGVSAARGLKRLRELDPEGMYDYNHVYLDSALEGGQPAGAADAGTPTTLSPAAAAPGSTARVGLIDGGVDGGHQVFSRLTLRRHGCRGAVVPSSHGTAVASILAGNQQIAEIFAVDVYCGEPTGGAVDAVAAAFGWLAREKVAVINVSLVGPRNALLERLVNALVARGHVIVAAVGNDGPAAPPLFPASYDGVVGVTAVDSKQRVLIEAGRGKQVDFAAPGADVHAAALAPDGYARMRGTSFAAPAVAAMLAELPTPDASARTLLLDRLAAQARDLGKPGRDDVYGAGLLGSYK